MITMMRMMMTSPPIAIPSHAAQGTPRKLNFDNGSELLSAAVVFVDPVPGDDVDGPGDDVDVPGDDDGVPVDCADVPGDDVVGPAVVVPGDDVGPADVDPAEVEPAAVVEVGAGPVVPQIGAKLDILYVQLPEGPHTAIVHMSICVQSVGEVQVCGMAVLATQLLGSSPKVLKLNRLREAPWPLAAAVRLVYFLKSSITAALSLTVLS